MKYKTKDGRTIYTLAECKFCKKSSNTTDKETAQMSFTYGRVCRACKKNPDLQFIPLISRDGVKPNDTPSIWERIKGWFK